MFLYSPKICYSSIIYTLVNEILGYIQNIIVIDIVKIHRNWLSVSHRWSKSLNRKKAAEGRKGWQKYLNNWSAVHSQALKASISPFLMLSALRGRQIKQRDE